MDRILGKSWWPDVCHLSQGAHTPYTRGIPWVKSPERVRLTGGRACWRERGHSYRSISSYRKLPQPACPGTAWNDSQKSKLTTQLAPNEKIVQTHRSIKVLRSSWPSLQFLAPMGPKCWILAAQKRQTSHRHRPHTRPLG